MKTINEKANCVLENLNKMFGQYRDELKHNTAERVLKVRIELQANPEVAARLYDLLMEA